MTKRAIFIAADPETSAAIANHLLTLGKIDMHPAGCFVRGALTVDDIRRELLSAVTIPLPNFVIVEVLGRFATT